MICRTLLILTGLIAASLSSCQAHPGDVFTSPELTTGASLANLQGRLEAWEPAVLAQATAPWHDAERALLVGLYHYRLGLYPLAADDLAQAAALKPTSPVLHYWLGLAHQNWARGLLDPGAALDHREVAEAALRKALELQPQFDQARRDLAVLYIRDLRLPAAAGPHLDQLLTKDQANVELLYLRARVLLDQKDLPAAAHLYERIARDSADPLYKQEAETLLRRLKGVSL